MPGRKGSGIPAKKRGALRLTPECDRTIDDSRMALGVDNGTRRCRVLQVVFEGVAEGIGEGLLGLKGITQSLISGEAARALV